MFIILLHYQDDQHSVISKIEMKRWKTLAVLIKSIILLYFPQDFYRFQCRKQMVVEIEKKIEKSNNKMKNLNKMWTHWTNRFEWVEDG